jgi:hypothetical protein
MFGRASSGGFFRSVSISSFLIVGSIGLINVGDS